MIWNSIPFMTAIDLLIIAVTIYTIWRCRLIGSSKRPSAPQSRYFATIEPTFSIPRTNLQ